MNNLLNYYQHLPEHINPVAFKVGFFSVSWYSLMYLVAFAVVYFLLKWRIRRGEFSTKMLSILPDFMFYAIPGVLIGGRLGYVLFYNFPYYVAHPLEIISPISVSSLGLQITGIYGMSFHGGLIGVVLASLLFIKKYKLNFWQWADFVVPAVPAGYFFGRIGNFLNGELYGRATEKFWGMYFPAAVETQNFSSLQLRHPSQLYEAFLEGLVLFLILWTLRNIKTSDVLWPLRLDIRCPNGGLFALYLFLYGFARFCIEFFRDPDPQIGLIFAPPVGGFTLGQLLSVFMIASGAIIFFVSRVKNRYNGSNE